MKIIKAFPPNYAELKKNFDLPGNAAGIAFAWGDRIYAPRCGLIAPEIVAHEKAHAARQGTDVEGWWRKYIYDLVFRLDEEIIGHRAELRHVMDNSIGTYNHHLSRIAKKLASPIYGRLISLEDAVKELSQPA